jgi:hypothetical protein
MVGPLGESGLSGFGRPPNSLSHKIKLARLLHAGLSELVELAVPLVGRLSEI